MENNLIFKKENLNIEGYNHENQTLTIENKKDVVYHLVFDGYIPDNFKIVVRNSKISIIESYEGKIENGKVNIDVDSLSTLYRFSIFLKNESDCKIERNINNHGVYESMQLDLTEYSLDSIENINMKNEGSYANIIDGIYATKNTNKKYQTNINHLVSNATSHAKIFAINGDNAHVSIYTDAYINRGAVNSKTDQEGRIINLSDTCSGIVLPNLHIDENDVEASHSCSVGSVNQEHMYYLQSRGMNEKQARDILILGYFNPIIQNIKDENIQHELDEVLKKRIVNI